MQLSNSRKYCPISLPKVSYQARRLKDGTLCLKFSFTQFLDIPFNWDPKWNAEARKRYCKESERDSVTGASFLNESQPCLAPPSPATNATANLDAPSRRESVNY